MAPEAYAYPSGVYGVMPRVQNQKLLQLRKDHPAFSGQDRVHIRSSDRRYDGAQDVASNPTCYGKHILPNSENTNDRVLGSPSGGSAKKDRERVSSWDIHIFHSFLYNPLHLIRSIDGCWIEFNISVYYNLMMNVINVIQALFMSSGVLMLNKGSPYPGFIFLLSCLTL